MNFNEQQIKAINAIEGQVQLIANAGSGKTTVLTNRVANMIQQGINPRKILCVSFTRASAEDLKKKLSNLKVRNVTVGTFHAICGDILRQEGYNLSNKLFDFEIENAFNKANIVLGKVDTKSVMGFIGYQKNNMRPYGSDYRMDYNWGYSEKELDKFYLLYENLKKSKNAYDFDDYLLLAYKVLSDNPGKYSWDYIMVDEHQDSNLVQNKIIPLLCPKGNIFVIGDVLQTLYGFRGSTPELFMDFDKTYPEANIINMNTNYRSTSKIVALANNFARKYYGDYRYYKDAEAGTDLKTGKILEIGSYSEREEASNVVSEIQRLLDNGVAPSDIAVLYRVNSSADYVESELKNRNIPYYIDNEGGGFFSRKEIKGILSVLRLVADPSDDLAYEDMFSFRAYPFSFLPKSMVQEIRNLANCKNTSMLNASVHLKTLKAFQSTNLNTFKRMIDGLIVAKNRGASTVKLIEDIIKQMKVEEFIRTNNSNMNEIEDKLKNLTTLKDVCSDKSVEEFLAFAFKPPVKKLMAKKAVKLMTIHKSKGLEFENVFIIGLKDGVFPHEKSDLLSEARVFYVGITRPIQNLWLSSIGESTFVEEYFN